MSYSFPKEIIITEEFTLRDETGNSITFDINGTPSSVTSAGGIITKIVNDPKFSSSAFVDLLNNVFNAGFVLEDDEYLTTAIARTIFIENTGGTVNNFLSVLGRFDVSGNVDISGNITASGNLNIGDIFSSGQIYIDNGSISISNKIDIDGGGFAQNSTTEFKPISIGYESSVTGGQNSTITIGNFAGKTDQKLQAISIGNYAGNVGQNQSSIAFGVSSGQNYQRTSSIAIGTYAGQNQQDNFSISIGDNSGRNRQGERSIALGLYAGFDNQLGSSISIGDYSGSNNQKSFSVAIGSYSGKTSQGQKSVSIGYYSGETNQSDNSIAIGPQAAENNQLSGSIAIGNLAGQNQQNINSIAIGNLTAQHNQSSESVAIGHASGAVNQGTFNVAVGRDSAQAYQATQSVAIGYHAGAVNQGLGVDNNYAYPGYSVAVGAEAGMTKQGNMSSALGYRAGYQNQGQLSVALGHSAGRETQGYNCVAVGVYSGENFQGTNCVSIGKSAARNNQQQFSIAIGLAAATTNQGSRCIAIGEYAGLNYQKNWSIAIGGRAARYNQQSGSIAIGPYAGDNYQNTYSVSLGYESGYRNQNSFSVAIGRSSGKTFQSDDCISIGQSAGENYQSSRSVAIGKDSGTNNQKINSVAIGPGAGRHNQGKTYGNGATGSAVAIGYKSGNVNQSEYSIAIGHESGYNYQQTDSISIGTESGYQNQSYDSIAIGHAAGKTFQKQMSVAIGYYAGNINQDKNSVAIGNQAGYEKQSNYAVALGHNTGYDTQGGGSVAIGNSAGKTEQGTRSVAIGRYAGVDRQGDYAIAIGNYASHTTQGDYSISIGSDSTDNTTSVQPANSISLNATGTTITVSNASSFYVNPIRNIVADTNVMYSFLRYNWRDGEIFQNTRNLDLAWTGSYNQKIRWNVTGVNSGLTNETGPNQIQLWSDARYGFGIEDFGVKYHSNRDHNFYYYSGANPSITNGTRVLQLNYSNAIVTGNIAANGVSSPIYPLDFNGISHAGAQGFHSGKIIYYDRLDSNTNLSEVSADVATIGQQGQVRFTGGACEFLGIGHIITNTYDFRSYYGHGYFNRTEQDIRDNSIDRREISTRILLKLNANFYSHDAIDEFFKIELLDKNDIFIDTLYIGCSTERNNSGYIPIVCDLTQYITRGNGQFRFKFSQTANGLGDYTFIKNFTICLDDSTSWYNFSTFNSNVINNLKIGAAADETSNSAAKLHIYARNTASINHEPAIKLFTNDRFNTTVGSTPISGSSWRLISVNNTSNVSNYSGLTTNALEDFEQVGINLINYNTNGTGQFGRADRTKTGIGFTVRDLTTLHENALAIKSNGDVGIGTTAPEAQLELSKANGTSFLITNPNGYFADQDQSIEFRTNYATTGFIHQKGSNLRIGTMGTAANDGISFYTQGGGGGHTGATGYTNSGSTPLINATYNSAIDVPKMKIIANGNIGIGTTSPDYKLHVETSTTYDGIVLYNGNDRLSKIGKNTNNSGYLQLREDDSTKILFNAKAGEVSYINNGGNVGIGTNNPGRLLEVYRAGGGASLEVSSANTSMYLGTNDNTDGYLWVESNDDFKIGTNNTERMRITSAGNVGIGTNSPDTPLHVFSSVAGLDMFKITANNAQGHSAIVLENTATSGGKFFMATTGTGWSVGTNKLIFGTNNTGSPNVKMTMDSAGNFGIGTSSPAEKLHVYGDTLVEGAGHFTGGSNTNININTTPGVHIGTLTSGSSKWANMQLVSTDTFGGWIDFTASNNHSDYEGRILYTLTDGFSIFTDTTERMRIDSNGNVGIGITNPSQKLDVAGNGHFTGSQITINPSTAYSYFTGTSGTTIFQGQGGTRLTAQNGPIAFHAGTTGNSNERMRISNNGNVGIGNTTPSEKLSIGSGGNLQFKLDEDLARDTTSAASALSYFKSKEQNIIRTANKNYRNNGDGGSLFDTHKIVLGYSDLNNMDYQSGGYYPKHHAIKFQMIPNWETGYDSVNVVYPAAGSIEPTTMMVINGDGNVGIGTESPNYNLDVSGDVHFSGAIIGESTYSKRFNFYSNDTQQIELTLQGGGGGFNNIYIELKVSAGADNSSGAGTVHNYYLLQYYNTDVDANLIRSYKTPYSTTSDYHLASVSYVQSGTKIKIMVNPHNGYAQTVDGWIYVSIYSDGPTISATSHTTVTDAVTENSLVTNGKIALGGNLGIGTDNHNTSYKLDVNGTARIGYPSSSGNTTGLNSNLTISAGSETSEAALYLATPFLTNGARKTAIIAQGDTGWSRSKLMFCLSNSTGSYNQGSPGTTDTSDARMTLLSNGNVGIGTTSPASILHIFGDRDNATQVEGIHLGRNSHHNGGYDQAMEFVCTGDNAYLDFKKTTGNSDFDGRILYNFSNQDMTFSTDNTVRMTLKSSGLNVNTGFSVSGGGSTFNSTRSVGVHLATLTGGNVNGTEHSVIELVSSNDNGSWIDFKDSSSGNADREGRIRYGYGGITNGLQFETAQTVRMQIGNNGNVGIGTTSPGELLETKGNIFLNNYSQNSNGTRTGGKLLFDSSFDVGGNGAEGPQKIDLYGKLGDYGFGVEGSTTTYFAANKHKWYTTSGSTTARMILDSDKLGIGTTSPGEKLDVNGNILIDNGATGSNQGGRLIFDAAANATGPNKIKYSSSDDTFGIGLFTDEVRHFSSGKHSFYYTDIDGPVYVKYIKIDQNGQAIPIHEVSLYQGTTDIAQGKTVRFGTGGASFASSTANASGNGYGSGGANVLTDNNLTTFHRTFDNDDGNYYVILDDNVDFNNLSAIVIRGLDRNGGDALTKRWWQLAGSGTNYRMTLFDSNFNQVWLAPTYQGNNSTIFHTVHVFALPQYNSSDLTTYSKNNTPSVTASYSYTAPSNLLGNDFIEQITFNEGNVGIGTSSPGQKLDVSGNIAATGSITSGATFTSNAVTTLFQGATNTHLRAETGQILLVANGAERMRVDTDGNVGIGTTSPFTKLTIGSTSSTSTDVDEIAFRSANNSTTDRIGYKQRIAFYGKNEYDSGNHDVASIECLYGDNVHMPQYQGYSSSQLIFSTHHRSGSTSTERMRIDYDGNVGIGTTSPSQKLHVAGGVQLDLMPAHEQQGTLTIGRQDSTYRQHSMTFYNSQTEASNYMAFNVHDATSSTSSPVERMRILGNGNVGIGTTSPNAKLHVNGNISGRYLHSIGYTGLTKQSLPQGAYVGWNEDSGGGKIGFICSKGTGPGGFEFFNVASDTTQSSSASPIANISSSGNLNVIGSVRGAYDSNTTSYFGRAAVGYVGHNDWCGFAHIDTNSTTNYALLQSTNGWTILNSTVGQNIQFGHGNVGKMWLNNGNLGIGLNNPSYKLDVTGDINFTGTLYQNGSAFSGAGNVTNGSFSVTGWSNNNLNTSQTPGVHIGTHGNSNSQYGYIQLVAPEQSGSWIDWCDTANNNTATDFEGRIRYASGGSLGGMTFYTNGNNQRMKIDLNGFVGIGGTPSFPLDVLHTTTVAQNFGHTARTFAYNWDPNTGNYGNQSYVIRARYGGIISYGVFAAVSDRRIKTNIIDVQDDTALQTLRLLKPKTYSYKDKALRGNHTVYGFIAQEVRDVLPDATSLISSSMPNIYEMANASTSEDGSYNKITFTDFDTADLDASSNKLEIVDYNDKRHCVNISKIIDSKTIIIDTNVEKWMAEIDASGNIIENTIDTSGNVIINGTKIFVYGQEVDDFHTLSKSAIFTVATAALQEVDRQLQTEKIKTASLETKVTSLETQLAAVLARLDALENN